MVVEMEMVEVMAMGEGVKKDQEVPEALLGVSVV